MSIAPSLAGRARRPHRVHISDSQLFRGRRPLVDPDAEEGVAFVMETRADSPPLRVVRPPDRAQASSERLAFNYGRGSVPSRQVVEAVLASEAEPTFATAAYAEPRDWGYVGLYAFTAVLLLRPQDHIHALRPLHLAEICALIGIAPMLLHRLARRLPVFRVTPETIGLTLFGLVIVATAPFSIWPSGALSEFTDSYIKILIVFVLMMNTLTTPQRLERITWLIIVSVGYIAGRGVIDYARGVNMVENSGRLAGAVSGIFGNPNDLAMNMVTFMPAAAIIAISRQQAVWRRLIAAGIVVLMLATIVFTKSRGGVVGLTVMLAAFIVLGGKVRRGFGAIAVACILTATPFMPASFWSRMQSMFDEKEDRQHFTGSSEARRVLMIEGMTTFIERPFTGVGAGQFKNYNPAGRRERWRETHNALIQVAAETGICGLLAFSFLIYRAAMAAVTTRRMLSPPRKRHAPDPLASVLSARDRASLYNHTVAMTAGVIGWFVCSMFGSIAYNWTFYYVLALIIAAREMTRDRLIAAHVLAMPSKKPMSVPEAKFSRRVASGVA
jgi:O-antigen ligase